MNSSNNPYQLNNEPINHDKGSLRQLVEKYLYYWKWFVFAVLLALIAATIYLRYATKEYAVNAQILLNEKESTSPELAALSDAAASFMGSSSNAVVNDQIKILQSRRLIFKTIQRHHLNVQYFVKGKVNTTEIMDSDAFALVTFVNDTHYTEENFKGNLVLEAVSNDAFKVIESDIVKEGTYGYNTVISSEIGAFSVSANKKNQTKGTMVVKFSPVLDMVAKVKRKLNITPDVDKNSMIVNF